LEGKVSKLQFQSSPVPVRVVVFSYKEYSNQGDIKEVGNTKVS